ncbi:hypothetical protein, partial [Endozoicomonas ascidiicola]
TLMLKDLQESIIFMQFISAYRLFVACICDIWAKETDDINSTSRLDSVIFDFIAAHLRFLLSSPTAS